MAFKLLTHKWMAFDTEKFPRFFVKVVTQVFCWVYCLKCFWKCEIWNLHKITIKKSGFRIDFWHWESLQIFHLRLYVRERWRLAYVWFSARSAYWYMFVPRFAIPNLLELSEKCDSWLKKKCRKKQIFLARPPLTSIQLHLSMFTLPGPGDNAHASRWAYTPFQVSMCMLPVEHVHTSS